MDNKYITECKFYDEKKRECSALNKLYCKKENKPCAFHKEKEVKK